MNDQIDNTATKADDDPTSPAALPTQLDALIVGAGFAGLYAIIKLRQLGLRIAAIDSAAGIGGTWYHNRYPGARCDIPSLDYCYSFDAELEEAWTWSEKYATQPEILAYLNFVADRYQLRESIFLNTRLNSITWDDDLRTWDAEVGTDDDETITVETRHVILATGSLSVPNDPQIDGIDHFDGDVLHTGRWPHEPVDFSGRSVAVVGTGSSGIQSIPLIAEDAESVSVFQRTPNYSMPAQNGPLYQPAADGLADDRDAYRESARRSRVGVPVPVATENPMTLSDNERTKRFEQIWGTGHLIAPSMFVSDLSIDAEANELFAEFIRGKIRDIVDDQVTAELLAPKHHPYGAKRPCLDTNYYETFNRDNVRLIDVNTHPIRRIEPNGVRTDDELIEVDTLVLATGFDAMSGAVLAIDAVGRDGCRLADAWEAGPATYLGLMTYGFPNLFMVTGPGSPSVLSNMAVSIEQHIDWIAGALADLDNLDVDTIEPTESAQEAWSQHVDDAASITLLPRANSWYMGANIDGKPQRILPYVGGVGHYRKLCEEVVERGYLGFEMRGPGVRRVVDGPIAPLQIDVSTVLEVVEKLDLPPLNTLSPPEARTAYLATRHSRPAGPAVAEERSGTFAGPGGELAYQLYLPDTPHPPPVVVYFHGGGWVLGDATSDEPFCRDLCNQSGVAVLSLDYRHAPEHRYPAAADDAWAGWRWAQQSAEQLGVDVDRMAIAGHSAGGNLAAVVTQRAVRESRSGPGSSSDIDAPSDGDAGDEDGQIKTTPPRAQLLLMPVTDTDTSWPSYREHATGYLLTAELMDWFFDHYVARSQRADASVAPLRADLAGLPPTMVVTAEFDPLRDQGEAYATAAAEAGAQVIGVRARGQIHTSLHLVGVVRSAAQYRTQAGLFLAEALTI